MINQIICVGRLVSDPKIIETENGGKVTTITLAIPRSYKNVDGVYETDFITCRLWNGITENCKEFCRKGDILGVKGRIQTTKIEDEYVMEVIAEKVTFLSSRKSESEE